MRKKREKGVELPELRGRIVAKKRGIKELAPKVGLAPNTLYIRLNGYGDFTGTEIFALCTELEIDKEDMVNYFFPQMFPKETSEVMV